MKKKILVVVLILGFIFSGYVGYRLYNSTRVKIFLMESKMTERFYEPVLGLYDRNNKMDQATAKSFRHFALVLNNRNTWDIGKNLLEEIPSDVPVLLTVEMWDYDIVNKTARGENDEKIRNLFSEILQDRKEIYIRWNPEMDVPTSYYPWGANYYYAKAFRHFQQICKSIVPGAKFVWGPSGYAGVLENYPGDDVVDAASITLNSTTEKFTDLYKEKTIPDQIRRKLHRMRFIDKPVFILGSQNLDVENFQDKWVLNALDTINKHKNLIYSEEHFSRPVTNYEENNHNFMVGFYDPDVSLVNERGVTVEHLFFDFLQIESGIFLTDLNKVFSRDHDAIVSIEPTYWDKEKDSAILKRIAAGEFDTIIKKFYSSLPQTNKTIYLRFAHEMEIPITRYAWQSQDPLDYIKAFRHFMNYPHNNPVTIKKVWGPAGDRGSLEWWPGNDAVDYISIAIYGLPDKNITDPNLQETFSKIFNRKIWRFRFVDKPIFITEFGVKGDEEYQMNWLKNAAETVNKEPQVIGVNYFNMTDVPKAWGEIQPPDWSISKKTFSIFLEALHRDDLHTAENLN